MVEFPTIIAPYSSFYFLMTIVFYVLMHPYIGFFPRISVVREVGSVVCCLQIGISVVREVRSA